MIYVIAFLLLIIAAQLYALTLKIGNTATDRRIAKYLPAIEAMLYILYHNHEERLGVKLGDRIPRRSFSEVYQERYGYETNDDIDARIKSDKEDRKKASKE